MCYILGAAIVGKQTQTDRQNLLNFAQQHTKYTQTHTHTTRLHTLLYSLRNEIVGITLKKNYVYDAKHKQECFHGFEWFLSQFSFSCLYVYFPGLSVCLHFLVMLFWWIVCCLCRNRDRKIKNVG